MERFAAFRKRVLVVYARYDLTFLPQYSEQVIENFARRGVDFVVKVLPCGHYTTGETPYKFLDGWYRGRLCIRLFGIGDKGQWSGLATRRLRERRWWSGRSGSVEGERVDLGAASGIVQQEQVAVRGKGEPSGQHAGCAEVL